MCVKVLLQTPVRIPRPNVKVVAFLPGEKRESRSPTIDYFYQRFMIDILSLEPLGDSK